MTIYVAKGLTQRVRRARRSGQAGRYHLRLMVAGCPNGWVRATFLRVSDPRAGGEAKLSRPSFRGGAFEDEDEKVYDHE